MVKNHLESLKARGPGSRKVIGKQTNKWLHTIAHMKSCTLFQGIVARSGRNWSLQTSGHKWGIEQRHSAVMVTWWAQSSTQGSSCAAGAGGGRNYAKHSYNSAPFLELTLARCRRGRRRPRPLSGSQCPRRADTSPSRCVKLVLPQESSGREGKYSQIPKSSREHSPELPAVP